MIISSKSFKKLLSGFNTKLLSTEQRVFYHHRVSALFPPASNDLYSFKKNEDSFISPKLMTESGLIADLSPGLFCILPLGLRAVEKLTNLVDRHMKSIGAQKMSLPFLTNAELWRKSGRLELSGSEVGKFEDRHGHGYVISPTHEEAIADVVSRIKVLPVNQLPYKLYQISPKFRDEMRIKSGLIRSREFIMKDLYTFDKDLENAKITYDQVLSTYDKIFDHLNIMVVKAEASSGPIGGSISHEYHVPLDKGDDLLYECEPCKSYFNKEVFESESTRCPKCNTESHMKAFRGQEVAHAFLLGERYSKPLAASYMNKQGKQDTLSMGCFGIGITRLLSILLEIGSGSNLQWPDDIVPYKVCLIPPKKGSKEDIASSWCDHLEQTLNKIPKFTDEVIVDDRVKLTIGRRLSYAKFLGFPIIIVVGKKSTASIPLFELHNLKSNTVMELSHIEIINYLTSYS